MALFVTSLVAIAAIAMITRLQIDIHRTELLLNAMQANLYAQGSLDWAMEQLKDDIKKSKSHPNQLIDATPIHSPIQKINGMTVASIIYDAQGRYNLNNLIDPKNQPDLVKLIVTVSPNTSLTLAQQIAAGVSDWITSTAANDSFTEYYLKFKPPYRSPHRPMISVSELRLVKGVNAKLFAALSHYVTALPEITAVNINNASPPVLMSISPTLGMDAAKALAAECHATPLLTIDQFKNLDMVKNHTFPDNKITVLSRYFLVVTNVTVGEQHLTLYTLLQRNNDTAQPSETVLWQSKGTL